MDYARVHMPTAEVDRQARETLRVMEEQQAQKLKPKKEGEDPGEASGEPPGGYSQRSH